MTEIEDMRKELEKGYGHWENFSPTSKCRVGNLCEDKEE